MATNYVLSESDVRVLRDLLARERRRPVNTVNRPREEPEQGFAPEVYVARVPASGIPALTATDLDSTGTGTLFGEDLSAVPGSAECAIYRLEPTADDSGGLVPVFALRRTVRNLSATEVDADTWVLVARDKFGEWYVTGNAGSVFDVGTGTGTDSSTGSVIVEEVDGLPSVVAALIRFDQEDGLRVSETSSGVARIDILPASCTTAGVVTTEDQVWCGRKTFGNTPIFIANALFKHSSSGIDDDGDNLTHPIKFAAITDGIVISRIGATEWSLGASGSIGIGKLILETGVTTPSGTRFGVRLASTHWPSAFGVNTGGGGLPAWGVTTTTLGLTINGGIITGVAAAALDAAVITYTPAVLTDWDSDADPGNVDDALDELAERVDDLEAVAAYTDGDAQDAVGGILSDSDTIDFTYTSQTSIVADVIYQMSITADASGIKLEGDEASPDEGDIYANLSGKGWKTLSALIDQMVGGGTDGDLLYRSGGVWTVLPIGSEGDVLTVSSGAPAWVAP